MRILAKPAFSNKSKNPYNYLLYKNLEEFKDVEVHEFTPGRALTQQYDILHLHWPEIMLFHDSDVKSLASATAFLILIWWMKIRGTSFIWTIHNIKSHQLAHKSKLGQKIEQWYTKNLIKLLDGVITLSKASYQQASQVYPAISDKQHFVVPHGHYRTVYPNSASRVEARERLQIPEDDFVIGYFGQILPYKNVPALIQAFNDLEINNIHLLIAGNPVNRSMGDQIRKKADESVNITLKLEYIPDQQVQCFFKAADLMVFPYSDVLNSGSAILALSFDVPVLVPGQGSLKELEQKMGSYWVQTYDQAFTASILEAAVTKIMNSPSQQECDALDMYGWEKIASRTYKACQQLIDKADY